MVEFALLSSILVLTIGAAILYLQSQAETRIDEGRSFYKCADLCDPATQSCVCSGDNCSCQP